MVSIFPVHRVVNVVREKVLRKTYLKTVFKIVTMLVLFYCWYVYVVFEAINITFTFVFLVYYNIYMNKKYTHAYKNFF